VDFIAEKRPILKGRMITATPPVQMSDVMPMDFGRVEEVLGMKVSDFHTTEQVSSMFGTESLFHFDPPITDDVGYD
jgi:hypothetical protein